MVEAELAEAERINDLAARRNDQITFVLQIIAARHQAKLTQTEFAKLLGMTRSYIARIEGGKVSPTVETLNRLARALGKQWRLV